MIESASCLIDALEIVGVSPARGTIASDMDEKPDAEALLRGLRAIGDQGRELDLSVREARAAALEYQHRLRVLLFVLKQGPQIMGVEPETRRRLEQRPDMDEDWRDFMLEATEVANAEKHGDFPQLNGFGASAVWTGLEDAVNTLIELYVRYEPRALQSGKLKELKVDLVAYLGLPEAERPSFIVRQLENKLGSPLKGGLGVFESVLDALGIKREIDKKTRDTLYELHKVRNCVVHRRGVADRKLVEDCPFLGLRVGDPVRITSERFEEYFTATYTYLETLYAHVLGEPTPEDKMADFIRAIAEAKIDHGQDEESPQAGSPSEEEMPGSERETPTT